MIELYNKDNLDLLKTLPDNHIDLIYCDILYGTGRTFDDYVDLKPIKKDIEEHYIPRLIEMYRVLKKTGSIYLQMDTRINHWLRCIMDDIFGYENFKNELVWKYEKWSNKSTCFQRNHDIILFYAFKNAPFNTLKENITTRKRNLVEVVGGKKVSKKDSNGNIIYNLQQDRPLCDVFTDIPRLPNTGVNKSLYDTQKPIQLLERLIKASSNENDLVADFYLGSGTTAVTCKQLNRNFIGCDINPRAIEVTNKRLKDVFTNTELF